LHILAALFALCLTGAAADSDDTPAAANGDLDRAVDSTRIREDSALALTTAGVEFADRFLAHALLPADDAERDGLRGLFQLGPLVPSYDAERKRG